MTNQVDTASMPVANTKKPVKKTKIASLDRRKARAGWLFVLPFIIGFVILYVPIVFESIRYSFFQLDRMTGQEVFAGWANYHDALFVDASFVQTLLTGLREMAFDIPAILIFSLFVAVILNQKMVGRAAFRAIFFLPVVISTGLMENVMTSSYASAGTSMDSGMEATASDRVASALALEELLMGVFEGLGFGTGMVTYIVNAVASIATIINRSGVQILIFLASLQSISPAIYESCQIDGATSWETFWKITFPMVSPMILVNGVYTIIDNFTTNENSVMVLLDEKFVEDKYVSSAMGWMYLLVVLLIVGIVAAIFSAYVFYQRRD
ncbi:MAG: sugar ABC transporter permease [Ruminococcaceae bacterium]|nr:sugar ABC transporter permease [Oscillospiraceae bacterium]